jgi:hypothetical protein
MLNAVRYRYTILAAQVVNFMHQIVYSFAFQQYYARQQTACYLHVLHFVTPEFNDKLSTNNQELICPPFALVILQTSSHWHDNPPYCGLWNVVPSPVRLVEVLPEWMCICWSVSDTAAQFNTIMFDDIQV